MAATPSRPPLAQDKRLKLTSSSMCSGSHVGDTAERAAVSPEYREPEPPAPPPPPAPEFVDLTVPADAVLGLQIERTVSSELAASKIALMRV